MQWNWLRKTGLILGLWLIGGGAAWGLDAASAASAADATGRVPTGASVAEASAASAASVETEAYLAAADSLLKLVYHGPVERSFQHHLALSQCLDRMVRQHPEPQPTLWEGLEGLQYFKSADGRVQLLNWSIPNINGCSSYGGVVWVRADGAGGTTSAVSGTSTTSAADTRGGAALGAGTATGGATASAGTATGEANSLSADVAPYRFYPLQDFSSYQPYPEALILSPDQWWGAYYYQAVEHHSGDTLFLTLIGVNHSQNRYAQKVIEVLQVLPDGEIRFGAPIFKRTPLPRSTTDDQAHKEADYPNAYIGFKPQGADDEAGVSGASNVSGALSRRTSRTAPMCRIVFRFSPRVDMILRYDYQAYKHYRGKKAKETPAYMIVCDRLMNDPLSMDPSAARLVPSGGLYDAFVFQAPYWYPVENVTARNPNPSRSARHR